jgi:hypothetical protein
VVVLPLVCECEIREFRLSLSLRHRTFTLPSFVLFTLRIVQFQRRIIVLDLERSHDLVADNQTVASYDLVFLFGYYC